jgi:hypothetical protein
VAGSTAALGAPGTAGPPPGGGHTLLLL